MLLPSAVIERLRPQREVESTPVGSAAPSGIDASGAHVSSHELVRFPPSCVDARWLRHSRAMTEEAALRCSFPAVFSASVDRSGDATAMSFARKEQRASYSAAAHGGEVAIGTTERAVLRV
jgi:hypothetical protein